MITRLFRNNKGYKFSGTVHELVEESIGKKNGNIAAADVKLHHYGNAEPLELKKKKELYLGLCKKSKKNQGLTLFMNWGFCSKRI